MQIGWKKYTSDQWRNNDKCLSECERRHVCEKDYIWNPARRSCQNAKYLASLMNDPAITCDEIKSEVKSNNEETKTFHTNFNEKNITYNTKLLCFANNYITYHYVIDSCQYLLLSDKISRKTKTFITISQHKFQIKRTYLY